MEYQRGNKRNEYVTNRLESNTSNGIKDTKMLCIGNDYEYVLVIVLMKSDNKNQRQ